MKISHVKVTTTLALIVIIMFLFGFALVPIYNSLCQVLGINGKVNLKAQVPSNPKFTAEKNRLVTVEFIATNNSTLPWDFYPKVAKIKIHPGEMARLAFYAENKTSSQMTVQAIPSVTPSLAAKYLKKTECFCFTQQTLKGHEAMDMPLLFYLDQDLPNSIKTITLAYTLFDISHRQK